MNNLHIDVYACNILVRDDSHICILSIENGPTLAGKIDDHAVDLVFVSNYMIAIRQVMEAHVGTDSYKQFIDTIEYGCTGAYVGNEYEELPKLGDSILTTHNILTS